MRIAWLHSHMMIWSGGAKFIYETASRINRVAKVDLYVERYSDEIAEMFTSQGITVTEFGKRTSTSYYYWIFFPAYLRQGIRFLESLRGKYDVFIITMFPMNYEASRAALHPALVYIFEPFAFFHDKDQIDGFPLVKRISLQLLSALYKRLDIEGTRSADGLMTINGGTRAWVKSVYGRDSSISLLGVNTDLFSPKECNPYRAKYRERRTVIHSTDWTPLKRTSVAIDVILKLRSEIRDILLLITCSSVNASEMKRLQQKVEQLGLNSHVEFLGVLSHEELPYYYELADLSLYTGIGKGASAASLFVLECMACGTPGVRTNFTDDEIQHNVSGYLYSPDDTGACVQYMADLLRDDGKRHRFGEAARKHVMAHYQWDNVAERIVKEVKRLSDASAR